MADSGNNRIRVVYPNGTVTTLVGTGTAGSSNTPPSTLANPTLLALDANGGFLYAVENTGPGTSARIRKVNISDNSTSTLLVSGTGTADLSTGTNPKVALLSFNVRGFTINPTAGMLYLADSNHVIKRFDLSSSTAYVYACMATSLTTYPSAQLATVTNTTAGAAVPRFDLLAIGSTSSTTCSVSYPGAMALDTTMSPARLFIADSIRPAVRVLQYSPANMTTFAGSGSGLPGSADGTGTLASFSWTGYNQVSGMAVGRDGSLYVTDVGNALVRKISSSGVVTTIAGVTGASGYVDGPAGSAKFLLKAMASNSDVILSGVAVDQFDNVYVSEISTTSGSTAHRIRKIAPYSCGAGQYLSGGSCFTCLAGWYQSLSAFAGSACTICPAGTWSAAGASSWCV